MNERMDGQTSERTNERSNGWANEWLFLFRGESRVPLARRIVKFWKIYLSLAHHTARYQWYDAFHPAEFRTIPEAKNTRKVRDDGCYIFKRSIISPVRWILTDWSGGRETEIRGSQGVRKGQNGKLSWWIFEWLEKSFARVVRKNDKWTAVCPKRSIDV